MREFLKQRQQELLTKIAHLNGELKPLEAELADIRRSMAAIGMHYPTDNVVSLPLVRATMTMKELAIKALTEHFCEGATSRQLLEFFRDAWGRFIERRNFSPQLTRLVNEGKITRLVDGRWKLKE